MIPLSLVPVHGSDRRDETGVVGRCDQLLGQCVNLYVDPGREGQSAQHLLCINARRPKGLCRCGLCDAGFQHLGDQACRDDQRVFALGHKAF
ncbi:MAG: hypothetical protein RLZZ491_917, partial [Pseudomonadota bacterium]